MPTPPALTYDHLPVEARPFCFKRGPVGVLLLHGFTGTPHVFRDLGEKLAEKDYTVLAPIISGHGLTPEDLEKTNWEDWCRSAEEAFQEIQQSCSEIFVIGASFGANLACYLATKNKLQGLVLIGIPRWIYKQRLAIFLTYFCSFFFRIRFYQKREKKLRPTSTPVLDTESMLSYHKIPTASLKHFFAFITRITTALLPKVTVPTLIIQSNNDGVVKPRSAQDVFRRLKTEDKQLVWINEPHYTLHIGKSRYQIYNYVTEFIQRWQ